jgi:hypothetical protein
MLASNLDNCLQVYFLYPEFIKLFFYKIIFSNFINYKFSKFFTSANHNLNIFNKKIKYI